MITFFTDPICGMELSPKTAAGSFDYKGETYYFCSLSCKAAFEEEPEVDFHAEPANHEYVWYQQISPLVRSGTTGTAFHSERGAEHASG